MSRLPLRDLRQLILAELDEHEWITPTQVCDRLGCGHGMNWYRVALLLERLCVEGAIEIKNPRGGFRKFRRRQRP